MKKVVFSFMATLLVGVACLWTYNVVGLPVVKMNKEVENRLENIIYLELKTGRVTIEMLPEYAPNHVARIRELVRKKFYDGLNFHRVIEGFMAQTGCPKGTGTGGSGKNLKAEFSNLPHIRGVVSMARASDPDSADSQFFIVTDDSKFLDGQYTVWGRVIDGMDNVDNIKKGSSSNNGSVNNPDKIISMRIAADAEKENVVKK
jgi:peptidylprolyl isomerase